MTPPAIESARVLAVAGLRRTVTDLSRSIDFYCGALGFDVVPGGYVSRAGARLALGGQHIDIVLEADPGPMPPPALANDRRFQHAAIVAADMDQAWQRLLRFAPSPITQGPPQRLPASSGGVTAFKFRDPDGHPLELIHFPDGVGNPYWRAASSRQATLGIDHFALAVADVEQSVAFYTAELGLAVASRSVNRGVEQDRLDGLVATVVEVVALVAKGCPHPPHLELLAYRSPVPRLTRAPLAAGRRDAELFDPDGHRLTFAGMGSAAPTPWAGSADAVVLRACRPDATRAG